MKIHYLHSFNLPLLNFKKEKLISCLGGLFPSILSIDSYDLFCKKCQTIQLILLVHKPIWLPEFWKSKHQKFNWFLFLLTLVKMSEGKLKMNLSAKYWRKFQWKSCLALTQTHHPNSSTSIDCYLISTQGEKSGLWIGRYIGIWIMKWNILTEKKTIRDYKLKTFSLFRAR